MDPRSVGARVVGARVGKPVMKGGLSVWGDERVGVAAQGVDPETRPQPSGGAEGPGVRPEAVRPLAEVFARVAESRLGAAEGPVRVRFEGVEAGPPAGAAVASARLLGGGASPEAGGPEEVGRVWAVAEDASGRWGEALGPWLDGVSGAIGALLGLPLRSEATPGGPAAESAGFGLRFACDGAEGPERAWLALDAGLLPRCLRELAGAGAPPGEAGAAAAGGAAHPHSFPALDAVTGGVAGGLEVLLDVCLEVSVELGRTQRQIREVLALVPGSLLELDRLAGDPIDVLVNGRRIARAEVVVVDERFAIRITDILSPEQRVEQLG